LATHNSAWRRIPSGDFTGQQDRLYGRTAGALATVPLDPFGNGTTHVLNGDDVNITQVAFDSNGNAYYTASTEQGNGSFGRIDLNTFTTSRLIASLPAAHGLVFDSFTNTLILSGDGHISQIDPANATVLSSDFTTTWAARRNLITSTSCLLTGKAIFLSLSMTERCCSWITRPAQGWRWTNFVSSKFLQTFLDDVAPLSGHGAPPVNPPPPPPGVPLPAAIWPGLSMLAGMGVFKSARKRKNWHCEFTLKTAPVTRF